MKKISNLLYIFASIPKTIYFNFRCLPFNIAIKLPFFIGYNVRLLELHKGIIAIESAVQPFLIRFGHGGSETVPANKSSIRLRSGKLTFNGKARFAAGNIIDLDGDLSFGKNLSTNGNCFFSCSNRTIIGNDVLFGWDIHLFDNDGGHTVYKDGVAKQKIASTIVIGDHVWICAYCHILKGAGLSDNSILGYQSLLKHRIEEDGVLVVGSPATIKQHNVNWSV